MREATYKNIIFIICAFVISFTFWGCAAPRIVKTVVLDRDRYVCKFDPSPFSPFQGKRIVLSTIKNKSKNTTDLFYYNPERTVGYRSYSSASADPQAVASYYWYGLQKAFACAGIRVDGSNTDYDADLSLTFHSLTDEEILFALDINNKGNFTYSQEYTVRMPKTEESNPDLLEKRAYGMLDAMVTTILNDPKVEKAFLNKNASFVHGAQNYENLKGIVLKNGTVITGEILNKEEIRNTAVNTVQIRTEQGRVVSYSVDAILFFY